MIQLSQPTEALLLRAADLAGETPAVLLDKLLNDFLEDRLDIQQAEQAMKEEGGISLEAFRAKHGV